MVYSRFRKNDLILRDYLARDRTELANERTLLAYIRTAIALLAAGGTLWEIFPDNISLRVSGILLLGLGFLVPVLGIYRFLVINRRLKRMGEDHSEQQ